MQHDLFMDDEISNYSDDRITSSACLEAIKSLSEKFPYRPISRDLFRQYCHIPEKDIAFHFGNFGAFKQAAGLTPSRDEKKVVSIQTKEVSVERLRTFNEEKWSWNALYTKKNNKRFQSFVVVCDIHDLQCDPFFRRMSIQAAKEMKVDHIVYNGDIFDHPETSTFSKRPMEYKPLERYKWVHDYFKDFKDASPDAEQDFVEGNHEFRLVKHLIDRSPYVMDVLDLHGWDVRKFLGLDQFEINYHSRSDFGTFTDRDIQNEVKRNYFSFNDTVLFHHYPKEGSRYGCPGISGHHHKFQAWPQFNSTYGAYTWYQSGGGCRRYADYQVTAGEQWNNGFFIVIVDTENKKNTIFNYVDTTGEFCYLNGLMHERTEEEKIFLR